MIYTIGDKSSYDIGLRTMGVDFKKLGALDRSLIDRGLANYLGGSVWETQEEAQAHIDINHPRLAAYAVYGVDADWDKDTYTIDDEPWSRLLKTSVITKCG